MTDVTTTHISDPAEVAELFERSSAEPVLVFKHDPYCPISLTAEREVRKAGFPTHVVDVAHDKQAASAITERSRVRHESPQVLVLHHGQATWSASHFDVTAEGIARAMEQAQTA